MPGSSPIDESLRPPCTSGLYPVKRLWSHFWFRVALAVVGLVTVLGTMTIGTGLLAGSAEVETREGGVTTAHHCLGPSALRWAIDAPESVTVGDMQLDDEYLSQCTSQSQKQVLVGVALIALGLGAAVLVAASTRGLGRLLAPAPATRAETPPTANSTTAP